MTEVGHPQNSPHRYQAEANAKVSAIIGMHLG